MGYFKKIDWTKQVNVAKDVEQENEIDSETTAANVASVSDNDFSTVSITQSATATSSVDATQINVLAQLNIDDVDLGFLL